LLHALSDNGFGFLLQLSDNKQYGFEGVKLAPEAARARLEFLCEYFRDTTTGSKGTATMLDHTIAAAKKRKAAEKAVAAGLSVEKARKKQSKALVERDQQGNIVYPIVVNPSISVLNLGVVEYERPGYHTEK
jgi:hypothetical protein